MGARGSKPGSFNRIGGVEAIAISDMIRKHADVTDKGDHRVVKYHEGWDDARVAKEVADYLDFKPTEEAVARLRSKAIGHTEGNRGNFGGTGPLTVRLKRIESEQAKLRHDVDELRRHAGLPVNNGEADAVEERGEFGQPQRY